MNEESEISKYIRESDTSEVLQNPRSKILKDWTNRDRPFVTPLDEMEEIQVENIVVNHHLDFLEVWNRHTSFKLFLSTAGDTRQMNFTPKLWRTPYPITSKLIEKRNLLGLFFSNTLLLYLILKLPHLMRHLIFS